MRFYLPMECDYLIVGSGLTGAVIARLLSDRGADVRVLERRSELGGNVCDSVHESGIAYHRYGPHFFRTSSERIWKFVRRFSNFYHFEARIKTLVNGQAEHWPIQQEFIRKFVGDDWQPAFRGAPRNFEEASLSMMPEKIYELFVKPYTEKQWGVPASSLEARLAKRFSVRNNGDTRLVTKRYQGLPEKGYAALMQAMLQGIPTYCGVDYLKQRSHFQWRKRLIFTGSIDEYFDFSLGRLAYRSQRREHEFRLDDGQVLPAIVLNNPAAEAGAHIRTIEWKWMLPEEERERIRGSLLTKEIPYSPVDPDEYEYPFPDSSNQRLLKRYKQKATSHKNVLICGRLGEYRYYDMDQAIARAMTLFERKLARDFL